MSCLCHGLFICLCLCIGFILWSYNVFSSLWLNVSKVTSLKVFVNVFVFVICLLITLIKCLNVHKSHWSDWIKVDDARAAVDRRQSTIYLLITQPGPAKVLFHIYSCFKNARTRKGATANYIFPMRNPKRVRDRDDISWYQNWKHLSFFDDTTNIPSAHLLAIIWKVWGWLFWGYLLFVYPSWGQM